MSLSSRFGGWLLKASSFVAVAAAVSAWSAGWGWLAFVLFIFSLALMIAGALIAPSRGTGAFFARDVMELNADITHVKPPGGNLTDSLDADSDERFRGR